jgi:hypothetical protein
MNNIKQESKSIAIYSMKLAGVLMQKGFVLGYLQPNPKFPDRNMFIFMNSPELKKAIDEYLGR